MASTSTKNWLMVCAVGLSATLVGCATAPSEPQPPKPQPPSAPVQATPQKTPGDSSETEPANQPSESKGKLGDVATIAGVDKQVDKQQEGASSEPGTPQSGAPQPDASQPDASQPDASQPGAAMAAAGSERAGREAGQSGQAYPPANSPESSSSEQPGGYLPIAQTDEEISSELERKLAASLSEFDGKLLRERKLLEESEVYARSGGFGPGQSGAEGSASTGVPNISSGGGYAPGIDLEQESEAAQYGEEIPPNDIPEDIASGQDDDIIARQIREAAENEADPVLREKLWEEYRKYKQSGSA